MVPDQQETMFDEPAELEPTHLEETHLEPTQFEPPYDEEATYEALETAETPETVAEERPAEQWHAETSPMAVHEPSNPPILTVDDFAALEERVLRAVSVVRREREARIAAEQRAATLEAELTQQQATNSAVERLQHEVDALRAEREQVRLRVERLLSQLDALEI
jgi:hypothetical protein